MKIGELGRLGGVNTKTIRYYEQAGLIPPPSRSRSGYREFEQDAVDRLRFIRTAQSVGLTLGEIREILAFADRGQPPCSRVTTLLEEHATRLDERIAALEALREEVMRLAARARETQGQGGDARYCHIIEIESRPSSN